ncbi:MAG: hypothetical protein ACOC84_00270 [Actinomycetota bacterium]
MLWPLVLGPAVVFASGLFLGVEAIHALGLAQALTHLFGHGESAPALLHLMGASVVGGNAVNGLPVCPFLAPAAIHVRTTTPASHQTSDSLLRFPRRIGA